MRALTTYLGLFAAALVALGGCGQSECDSLEADDSDNAPRITKMEVKQSINTDPWEVVFITDFTDGAGDLGEGRAEFFVGAQSDATTVKLFHYFRQNGVDLMAKEGQVAIPLRFGETVPDGARVRLSTQLVDATNRRSNCYSLDLRFDVKPAP